MNIEVELPDFGEEETDHATISEWHFDEGDLVLEGELLLEVTTESDTHEIPCPGTGILIARMVEEEDVVHVGEVLCIIDLSDESQSGDTELDDDYREE